jgi:hypothetical protein
VAGRPVLSMEVKDALTVVWLVLMVPALAFLILGTAATVVTVGGPARRDRG